MQDIPQSTPDGIIKTEQFTRIDWWEFDLTSIGRERHFFCNESNGKGEPLWYTGHSRICGYDHSACRHD